MQTQVYVDETKAKGYVVAAAAVLPGQLAGVRKALRALLPRAQRRLHMVDEADPLRRKILTGLADAGAAVDLYVAGASYPTDVKRRRACLERLVSDIAPECILLTLESDRTQDRRDRQDLALITRKIGCPQLRYAHESPYAEPLLWIPDAVGWAFARGGEWRDAARPIIRRVIDV